MKNLYLPLAFSILLLFSGCLQQELYQKVAKDGSSTLTVKYNFSRLLELSGQYGDQYGMPDGINELEFEQEMTQRCVGAQSGNALLSCSAEGSILTLSMPFARNNPYYEFKSEEGLLSTTYYFKLKKIPFDKFDVGTSDLETSSLQPPQALDLNNKTGNAEAAKSFAASQVVFTYTVEMPGSIGMAKAGSYNAKIEGNKAIFDMVKVLEDSAPIEVTTQEINLLFIIGAAALILLAFISLNFLKQKKHKKR